MEAPSIPPSFVRTQKIIHACLCFGMLAFTLFTIYTGDSLKSGKSTSQDLFVYLVPSVGVLCYFLSGWLFNNMLAKIPQNLPIQSRLARYQSALMVKWALLEGPAFLALAAYLQQANAMYLAIAVFFIFYFVLKRPKAVHIKNELSLERT